MKTMKRVVSGIVMALALLLVCGTVQQNAAAAGSYKLILKASSTNTGDTVKVGNYILRVTSSYDIQVKGPKDNRFYSTPIRSGNLVSNGTQVYYLEMKNGYSLRRYTLATKKDTTVKKLSVSEGQGWRISNAYGSNIYLTKSSFYQGSQQTYRFGTGNRKLSMVAAGCDINDRYGKYVTMNLQFRTDTSPTAIALYRITGSGGLTRVKKLTSYGFDPKFVGKKVYYASYPDYKTQKSMKKAVLYRCNTNGKGRVKLGTLTAHTAYTQIVVIEWRADSCDVAMDGSVYRFTYATKKLEKIR